MASMWLKIAIYVMLANSFIALLATPQFNILDKHYPNHNMYFNKTNMSVQLMTESQADTYYGRNPNVTVAQNWTWTSIFDSDQNKIIGLLATPFGVLIWIIIFLINFAFAAYTFVGIQILKWFGMDFMPIAVILQGGIDIVFTWGIIQILLKLGGRTLD